MADKKQPSTNTSVFTGEPTRFTSKPTEFIGKLRYTMTNDYLFKAFFQRNELALRGLLCALLTLQPEDISSVEITNPIQILSLSHRYPRTYSKYPQIISPASNILTIYMRTLKLLLFSYNSIADILCKPKYSTPFQVCLLISNYKE